MDINQKIKYAEKRIKELEVLISYWEKERQNKSLKDLKLTPEDYQSLRETTQEEYSYYYNNVKQG